MKEQFSNLTIANGKIGFSKILIGVNALSSITASKVMTRKELVLAQINKMSGYSKAEKLLLVYLLGFSLSDDSKRVLTNYINKSGATYKDAKELVVM